MNTTTSPTITTIDSITIESPDPESAARFYAEAFGVGSQVRTAASEAPTSGFRGFTVSLVTSQPGNVRALFDSAIAAGATVLKPVTKSLWGVGGIVQAPDGTIWNLATSAKKDKEPASLAFDKVVLLLGVGDITASKKFYTERGLAIGRSVGGYAEFKTPSSPVGFGLYKRAALAKTSGVPAEGSGSHRLRVNGAAADFTDPDGFVWKAQD